MTHFVTVQCHVEPPSDTEQDSKEIQKKNFFGMNVYICIPGVGIAIEDGVTVEDTVGVKPGGKHPASSISEQQSPKL